MSFCCQSYPLSVVSSRKVHENRNKEKWKCTRLSSSYSHETTYQIVPSSSDIWGTAGLISDETWKEAKKEARQSKGTLAFARIEMKELKASLFPCIHNTGRCFLLYSDAAEAQRSSGHSKTCVEVPHHTRQRGLRNNLQKPPSLIIDMSICV